MNTTNVVMAWLALALGVGLGALALKGHAQTATAVPMTVPQSSATPAAEIKPVPATTAAPAAASGDSVSQSGSGQGSPATSKINLTPAAAPAPAPAPATAPAPKPPQTALTPVDQRITDQAIRGDMALIRSYQARLKALNDTGSNPFAAYHYAKAVHWIDFALDEYEMKNRSGVIEQALDAGRLLIEGLEAKRGDLPMETAIVPQSQIVRNDLWTAAQQLKAGKDGFKCAGGDVARMEVQLVWAGHIQSDLGWRSAKPHLQAAERYYRDAQAAAATCPRPVAVKDVPRQAADDAALAKLPPAQQIEILADSVHFAYDRASISVATAPVLDRVASLLRANAVLHITIEGHADERGGEAYNLKLSQRRADAVRAYLMAAGVDAARLKTKAFGKGQPVVKAESSEGHALNRRVVFVPAGATGLKINPQREDLQIEKAGAAKRRAQ